METKINVDYNIIILCVTGQVSLVSLLWDRYMDVKLYGC